MRETFRAASPPCFMQQYSHQSWPGLSQASHVAMIFNKSWSILKKKSPASNTPAMLWVVHIENASFPQPAISKSRQKGAGIDHRGHQFSCILRFFWCLLPLSCFLAWPLAYQEGETLSALTSDFHSPFLACPTERWPCVLDFPLSTACRGRLNMQNRQHEAFTPWLC